ncbi:MAG: NADH-quinone oxidoreductase subunit C [candidate division Zixibacteria bacterium]|nr:NADH-quinone oxidoreductase subunit C [candidate division Zixibacteria bacterium]
MKEKLTDFLRLNFPEAVIREDNFCDQQSFYIHGEYLFDICRAFQSDKELEFNFLMDICSLDWWGQPDEAEGRFEVVYNLYSLKHRYRFFLKVRLPAKEPKIDSVTSLWHTADWLEREVYDMMGIFFVGHPDLRKIVTPDELDGYPLRKDFPLTYEVPQFSYNKDQLPEVIL